MMGTAVIKTSAATDERDSRSTRWTDPREATLTDRGFNRETTGTDEACITKPPIQFKKKK